MISIATRSAPCAQGRFELGEVNAGQNLQRAFPDSARGVIQRGRHSGKARLQKTIGKGEEAYHVSQKENGGRKCQCGKRRLPSGELEDKGERLPHGGDGNGEREGKDGAGECISDCGERDGALDRFVMEESAARAKKEGDEGDEGGTKKGEEKAARGGREELREGGDALPPCHHKNRRQGKREA